MPKSFKFWKKPWDREPCLFEVQEFNPTGKGGGWYSLTEPSAEPISIKDAREHFTPGKSYRLLARSVERGSFVGIVWTHYEPHPAGTVKKKETAPKEEKQRAPRQPRSATEYMKQYAEEVRQTLEPISELLAALQDFTGNLGMGGAPRATEESLVGPLQFSGQAPWVMHPLIVKEVTEAIKDVTDHVFDRFSSLGLGPPTPKEEEEEEGEAPLLPRARDYIKLEKKSPEIPVTTQPPKEAVEKVVVVPPEKPKKKKRRKKSNE